MSNRNPQDQSFADELDLALRNKGKRPTRVVLSEVAALGGVSLVAKVVPLAERQGLLHPVLTCLDTMLARARALDFIFIDEGQRSWSNLTISTWSQRRVNQLILNKDAALVQRGEAVSPTLVAFAACHENGFVREAALRVIGNQKLNRVALAISIIRCNDWVPSVRNEARRVVEANLTQDRTAEFAELLPLVLHLRNCGRDSHENLVDAACRLMLAGDGVPFLNQSIDSSDASARSAALEVARKLEGEEGLNFFMARLNHHLPNVRAVAFRELRSRLPKDELTKLARQKLSDHSGQVRRQALFALCQNPPKDLESILYSILFDPNRTVRWFTINQLKEKFGQNPAQRFRDELSKEESPHLEVSIDALGEYGKREDAALLNRFLKSERPRIHAAAIQSIARLDGNAARNLIADAIFNDSPRVSRAARECLSQSSISIIRHRLEKAMDTKMLPHVRRGACHLLLRLPTIDALEYALTYDNDPDDRVSKRARSYLQNCHGRLVRFYGRPPEKQVRRILGLLRPESGAHRLRDFLKSLLPH